MQNRSRYTALTNAAGLLAPTFALAAASLTSITVTITPAMGTTATYYIIRYSSANGNFTDPLDYATIQRTGTFTLTGLTAGATYYFSVAAANSIGSTAFSAAQSIAAAPVLTAIDNEDGRLSASWTQNNLVDAVNDTQVIEKSANGTTGWTTAATVAYNATSVFVTINNPALSQYYRLKVYRHSGTQTFYSNVVGPRTVTGDTDGYAYASTLENTDGVALGGDYTDEMDLFGGLRADGILSKLKAAMIFGYGNQASCRRELVSLGQGTIPGGTVTANAGLVAFTSSGRIRFPAGLDTYVSNSSYSYALDRVDALGGSTVYDFGAFNSGDAKVNVVFGSSAGTTAVLGTWANSIGVGSGHTQVIMASRTSAANGGLYHWDGSTFSTLGTSSGFSGTLLTTLAPAVGAVNIDGTDSEFTNSRYRSAWIFDGMSSAEWQLFVARYQAFKIAKGWS